MSASYVIGFGSNNRWVSRLIRWVSHGKYSHSWVEIECNGLGPVVLHAGSVRIGLKTSYGVSIVPDFQVKKDYPIRKRYRINTDLYGGLKWARCMVGVGYDFGVIWNGLLLVLLRLTGWRRLERLVLRNASKPSCSEMITTILKMSNASDTETLDPELTTSSGENPITISLESWCSKSQLCEVVEESG